jgi:hypothetical protein
MNITRKCVFNQEHLSAVLLEVAGSFTQIFDMLVINKLRGQSLNVAAL